ncbi:FAD-dependent oxidoreductase [Nakamurella leprariae]|uniref:FAD-dependent oxidoreductase n=1 Tax=Nakamurella leprariae TaxID=2803911 RepID=A0A938YGV9_9ACTN|nr:FAD-dependent oxidoreductase [Nakamurella leprariae]MBM9469281.1 FAD-dependent oxidoreductase [Nakamurella leprariae]
MSRSNADHVVVVGGGAMGSAAAWRLAGHGYRVTLLEQFGPGHDRGASHGSSRIFRHGYADPRYVDLAVRAAGLWRALERSSGTRLLRWTGAVDHGDPQSVLDIARVLRSRGVEHDILSPAAAARRWPGLRFDTVALHHPAAGGVDADASVGALQQEAARLGAVVRHSTPVVSVRRSGSGVRVQLADERIDADQVVLAGGAWSPRLAASLLPEGLPPLVTTQEQPAHFLARPGQAPTDEWPAFLHHPGLEYDGPGIYGLGAVEGVKVGEHGTGPVVDPDHRIPVDPARLTRLQEYVATWLPGVQPATAAPMSCLYTTSGDHNFIIDRQGPITVAAGFSGHGFKFTPVIGELIAGLVGGDRVPAGIGVIRSEEISAARELFSLSRPALSRVG